MSGACAVAAILATDLRQRLRTPRFWLLVAGLAALMWWCFPAADRDFLTVSVGDEYLGAVMTDLSNRRGQVVGTDSAGDGTTHVKALVPQSELSRYAIDLRGLARGTGSFTRSFHGYELMPANLAMELMKNN